MSDITKGAVFDDSECVVKSVSFNVSDDNKMVFHVVVYRDRKGVVVYDGKGNKLNTGQNRMEEALDLLRDLIRDYKKLL